MATRTKIGRYQGPMPATPRYAGERPAQGSAAVRRVFTEIYRRNTWGGRASVSGPGSELAQTRRLIRLLPALFRAYGVTSLLDLPCGDFHWMQQVDRRGVHYIGADIVPELIAANRACHAGADTQFRSLDLLRDPLPTVDLVLCRDGLVHLGNSDILHALDNIRASTSRYLLTTTFPGRRCNADIETGHWRPLDLEQPPFNLPRPLRLIREGCTEGGGAYADKSLGLWQLADLQP